MFPSNPQLTNIMSPIIGGGFFVVVGCCCWFFFFGFFCLFFLFVFDERHLLDILPNVRSDLMIILFTTLFRSPNHRERRHDTHPEVESYMHQMF